MMQTHPHSCRALDMRGTIRADQNQIVTTGKDDTMTELFPFSYEEFNNARKRSGYAMRELQAWAFPPAPAKPAYWINRGSTKAEQPWWDEFKQLEITNGDLTDIVLIRFSPVDADACMVFSGLGGPASIHKHLPMRDFA